MQASTSWDDVAFSSTEGGRHLGIRPGSQLNTWPVVSPVNASRRPSRDAAHHSGSGRLARPSPWGTFTSYSLPASWRTPRWVKIRTQCEPRFSGLPLIADIDVWHLCDGGKTPRSLHGRHAVARHSAARCKCRTVSSHVPWSSRRL